ncbi:MAG: phospholipase [Rhizobacter sp.]|nr:phospholipase [Rhizobacter sp.]
MRALDIYAGPRALAHLRTHGLMPRDVRAIPAAAGGPKGLVLNHLDRFLFADWLSDSSHTVHLLGASIGAWRMATGCLADARFELERMANDYIEQEYEHRPGKAPKASHVSELFAAKLDEVFEGREAEVLSHPRFRLHVFTSRGRHLLRREGRFMSSVSTPLGLLGAFASNAVSRRMLGGWLERIVFSDPRDPLPIPLRDYATRFARLDAANLRPSILASCSIPFWLDAVHDIPGAPRGAYWDGGLTDYHLHLPYAAMQAAGDDDGAGLVLYPHFQQQVIPGWLDKALKHRHRSSPHLQNVVVLAPSKEWIATLPDGKLPDRGDFVRHVDDARPRIAAWRKAVAESERLADEFAALVAAGPIADVKPL